MLEQNQSSDPTPSQDNHEDKLSATKSQKLTIIEGINRWSVYLFWFSLGVTIAHISRLFGAWILFLVFLFSVSGYLMFITPESNETNVYLRRACGLALFVSGVAYWDALIQIATLPIIIGTIILPAWLIGLIILVALFIISFGILLMAS